MTWRSRPQRNQRGAALIEAALVVPLLIIFAFGTIDVGRIIYTKINLNDVAQEGTIYGAYYPDDPTAIRQRVIDSASNLTLTEQDVRVRCPDWPDGSIRVRVRTTLTAITPFFAGHSFTLTAAQEGDILTDDVDCVPSWWVDLFG